MTWRGREATTLKGSEYRPTLLKGSRAVKISLANRCDTSTGLTTWAARKLTKTKRLNGVLFEAVSLRTAEFSAFSEVERCFRPRYPSSPLRRAFRRGLFTGVCRCARLVRFWSFKNERTRLVQPTRTGGLRAEYGNDRRTECAAIPLEIATPLTGSGLAMTTRVDPA